MIGKLEPPPSKYYAGFTGLKTEQSNGQAPPWSVHDARAQDRDGQTRCFTDGRSVFIRRDLRLRVRVALFRRSIPWREFVDPLSLCIKPYTAIELKVHNVRHALADAGFENLLGATKICLLELFAAADTLDHCRRMKNNLGSAYRLVERLPLERSPRTISAPRSANASARGDGLASTRTEAPSCSKRLTSAPPIKPVPPVTQTRMSIDPRGLSFAR